MVGVVVGDYCYVVFIQIVMDYYLDCWVVFQMGEVILWVGDNGIFNYIVDEVGVLVKKELRYSGF